MCKSTQRQRERETDSQRKESGVCLEGECVHNNKKGGEGGYSPSVMER